MKKIPLKTRLNFGAMGLVTVLAYIFIPIILKKFPLPPGSDQFLLAFVLLTLAIMFFILGRNIYITRKHKKGKDLDKKIW